METTRIISPCAAMLMLAALVVFTGCNQTQNSLFQKPGQAAAAPTVTQPQSAGPSPAGAPALAAAPSGNPPYALSAKSGGSFIDFSIYNLSDKELPIKREDFAIITADSRKVTPYDRDNVIIDLPQSPVVKPNDTLSGRALFRNVANPVGKRLVFKPDATGTFADITRP